MTSREIKKDRIFLISNNISNSLFCTLPPGIFVSSILVSRLQQGRRVSELAASFSELSILSR